MLKQVQIRAAWPYLRPALEAVKEDVPWTPLDLFAEVNRGRLMVLADETWTAFAVVFPTLEPFVNRPVLDVLFAWKEDGDFWKDHLGDLAAVAIDLTCFKIRKAFWPRDGKVGPDGFRARQLVYELEITP